MAFLLTGRRPGSTETNAGLLRRITKLPRSRQTAPLQPLKYSLIRAAPTIMERTLHRLGRNCNYTCSKIPLLRTSDRKIIKLRPVPSCAYTKHSVCMVCVFHTRHIMPIYAGRNLLSCKS